MTNFTVGPTPLQVIGQGVDNSPLTVQNTGAVSIYISADPGVSPTFFAYKIDAGGDFIWPPGKPLSVCTGPGVIGQISYGGNGDVHVNSGSTNVTGAVTINGTVPISGPVTVSGTVGISGGSVNLAGPVAISGGVSVTGSTINVGNSIALANNPVLIYNTNLAIGSGAGTYSTTLSSTVIIQSYSSLLIVITNTKSGGGVLSLLPSNYISLTVSCADSGGGSRSNVYNPQWLYVTQGNGPPNTPFQQSLQIPVTNTNLNIQTNVNVSAGYAGNVNIQVFGMGQIITTPLYKSDGDGFSGTIAQGGAFFQLVTSGITGPYYVGSKNGNTTLGIYQGNTTTNGGMTILIIDNGIAQQYVGITATGAPVGGGPISLVYLPMRPIQAAFTQVAGGAYIGSITQ